MHLPAQPPKATSVRNRFCAAIRPTANMILGFKQGDLPLEIGQALARLSRGAGSRLPGGRHFKTLAMYTCSRSRPMARSMEFSNWPARPTKGSPWRSSSAPGASPTISHCRLRVADAEHGLGPRRAQAGSACTPPRAARSSAQSKQPRARAVRHPAGGARRRHRRGRRRGARSRRRAPSAYPGLKPMAARYSLRRALFMRRARRAIAGAVCDTPTGRRRQAHNRRKSAAT